LPFTLGAEEAIEVAHVVSPRAVEVEGDRAPDRWTRAPARQTPPTGTDAEAFVVSVGVKVPHAVIRPILLLLPLNSVNQRLP
jgi:hypothetical protein